MREIKRQIEAGDHSGFGDLVREHQGFVFSLAYRFFADRAAAEDVAQEVFLDLYRAIGTVETREHLKMWLRRVTSHRCIDEARRRKVRPLVCVDEVPDVPAASREADPIMDGTLRRYVAALPDTQRMIVVLRYQEDLDPVEIAAALDMPLNSVKSSLQRALGLLREKVTRRVEGVRV